MADEMKVYEKGEYTGADIVMDEDGKFYIEDNGVRTAECVVKPYRDTEEIHLQPNSSNRKFWNAVDARKKCANGGRIQLTYKPSIKLGEGTTRTNIPNAKLIEYLDEADKAEYLAIIERAKANYESQKKKPMTEKEKLLARRAKIDAQLAALKEDESDAE